MVALHSNSKTTLQACTPSGKKKLSNLYAEQPMQSHWGWTPNKSPTQLKDNSKDIHKEGCYEVTYSVSKKQKHNINVLATSVTLTSALT
jgi:hypothetical protein